MNVLRLMVSRKWIITTMLVIVGSLICARLGIWQLDRLAQRRAFNAHYRDTSTLSALNLTTAPTDDLTSMEYRPVVVAGTYDFEHQVVLRNQVYNNQTGYHLLTPLILSDGTAILVDRGWIPPEGNAQPANWRIYDQPGKVTIKGILRLGQSAAEIGSIADPEQAQLDVWSLVNLARIEQQLPYKLLPVFVQLDPDPSLTKPPYPYQPKIIIDEGPHFGYALTWFSFAALLFFGYPFFYLPRQSRLSTGRQAKLEEK
jgi:surfeit locus 1 family protein